VVEFRCGPQRDRITQERGLERLNARRVLVFAALPMARGCGGQIWFLFWGEESSVLSIPRLWSGTGSADVLFWPPIACKSLTKRSWN